MMRPTFLELSIQEQQTAWKLKMTTKVMSASNTIRIYVSSAKTRYKNTQTTISATRHTYYSEGQREGKILPALNWEVEAWLHEFLKPTLDGKKWSASRSSCCTLRVRAPGTL